MPGNNRVIRGSGTPVTAGSSANTPPSSVTILQVLAQASQSAHRNATVSEDITVTYAPPSPIGNFQGVWVYVDAPDTSMGLAIADGTQPADGNTPATGAFDPQLIQFFPYAVGNYQFSFNLPTPSAPQFWRVYLVSGSPTYQNKAVQFGQPGASPSYQFYVAPPPTIASGREYAPLLTGVARAPLPVGWNANPNVFTVGSGDQDIEFAVTWQWPNSDPTFNTLGGFNLVIDDGHTQKYVTITYTPGTTLYSSAPFSVLPGTTDYIIWFLSYDTNGNSNTLVQGVTPSIFFTVTRRLGSLGAEYCALVTPWSGEPYVTAVAVAGADGTAQLQVDGWFNPPSDPSWGGAEVVVLKPDGNYYSVIKGTLGPIENFIPTIATVQNWAFFVRSIDINGDYNSIEPKLSFSGGGGSGAVAVATVVNGAVTAVTVLNGGTGYGSAPTVSITGSGTGASFTASVSGGVVTTVSVGAGGSNYIATPMIVITVGSATGLLNLSKAAAANFATQFAVIGTVFTVQTLSASLIQTGLLSVGGGSSMPGQIQVFDGLGSLIAWIGYNSPYAGGWFKQLYVGGASPASAPITADSAGDVSINGATFTLNLNSLVTTLSNANLSAIYWSLTSADSTWPTSGNFSGVYAEGFRSYNANNLAFILSNGNGNGSNLQLYNASTPSQQITMSTQTANPSININGIQVVTTQKSGPGNPSFSVLGDAQTWCQNLLTALRAHGLVT